jgi:hypothetical protein
MIYAATAAVARGAEPDDGNSRSSARLDQSVRRAPAPACCFRSAIILPGRIYDETGARTLYACALRTKLV